MNRVLNRINEAAAMVKAKLNAGTVTAAQVSETHCKLDMNIAEYCSFQEVKSLAQASGKLTFEEAQTVYSYLGNSVEHFNSQGIGVKVVLTQLFAQLLEWKMAGRKAA